MYLNNYRVSHFGMVHIRIYKNFIKIIRPMLSTKNSLNAKNNNE